MQNQELAFRLLAFVWAGCFAQPQEREMVLKIEKCNQKTHWDLCNAPLSRELF